VVDAAVDSVRADPEYEAAIAAAGRDEASLVIATNVRAIVEKAVRAAMSL